MRIIKQYSEREKLFEGWKMLQSAHILFGIQCQNCKYYNPDSKVDNYRGLCNVDGRVTYWSQYCDDFEVDL